MRLAWTTDGGRWRLALRLDPDESLDGYGQGRAQIQLVTNECAIHVPVVIGEPHPDLRALAAFLVASAWARGRVDFDRPVSSAFGEAVRRAFKVDVEPIDDSLSPREPGRQVGLSYSGGADSVAVSEMLGPGSPHVHLERVAHPRVPNRASHIRADVIAKIAREAGDRGRNVHIVQSDLEYLTLPWPQYPSWPAVAVGSVLLADELELGAVGFGSVMESRYLDHGLRYLGGSSGPWAAVFATCGLPFFRPSVGLTEIGTLRLALESRLADLVRSCGLGGVGSPCYACAKCLRKDLIAAAIEGRPLNSRLRKRLKPGDRVLKDLSGAPPYRMQPAVEYALARVPGLAGTPLADVGRRLGATPESTAWAARYYPRAIEDEVPQVWRAHVREFVDRRIGWMTDEDIRVVETWDAARRGVIGAMN